MEDGPAGLIVMSQVQSMSGLIRCPADRQCNHGASLHTAGATNTAGAGPGGCLSIQARQLGPLPKPIWALGLQGRPAREPARTACEHRG